MKPHNRFLKSHGTTFDIVSGGHYYFLPWDKPKGLVEVLGSDEAVIEAITAVKELPKLQKGLVH